MNIEWYHWLAAVAALASIVAAIVRIRVALRREKPHVANHGSVVKQRGRFNQNIVVNGGSKVDVQTKIGGKDER